MPRRITPLNVGAAERHVAWVVGLWALLQYMNLETRKK